ncbi:MAG: hypothetical protein M3N41_14460, partial [Acidobacteriota bacterium]|nr:hypothetical protein [Acidobacteriota bacterium]
GKLRVIGALWLLGAILSPGEGVYTLSLPNANPSLALPSMAARDGVVYVAYRSFDWLRSSNQLQVLAYDLLSRKQLKHSTIPLPKVTGIRISDGLTISSDGALLAYVEMSDPVAVILLETASLSEVRRSSQLPFAEEDRRRRFAGFDAQNQLSFESVYRDQPHFVRLNSENFRQSSDVIASRLKQRVFSYVTWNPKTHRFWLPSEDIVGSREYTEQGDPTGEVLQLQGRQLEQGAIALGQSDAVAFFGQLAKGTIVSHRNHQDHQIQLPCVPSPVGANADPKYVEAICVTHPDVLPESGGDRVSSSELLIVKTEEPMVVWRQKLILSTLTRDNQLQQGVPVHVRQNEKMWIVVPEKSSELTVYEVASPK